MMADQPSNQATVAAPAPAWRTYLPRLLTGAIFLATFGVLVVAAWLEPSNSGTGTHEQLGLPACGFLASTGLPCATCGMTTAFSHAADGNLLAAFITQPAGAVLAVLTAMTALVTGYATVTGMALTPLTQAIFRPALVVALIVLLVIGWIYTLANAFLGT